MNYQHKSRALLESTGSGPPPPSPTNYREAHEHRAGGPICVPKVREDSDLSCGPNQSGRIRAWRQAMYGSACYDTARHLILNVTKEIKYIVDWRPLNLHAK